MKNRTGMISAMVRKEFRQLKRDRRMLPIVFIAPVLQLLLLGYAANTDVRKVPIAIYDESLSAEARNLSQSLFASNYFLELPAPGNTREVDNLLESGKAAAVLLIPRSFGKNLAAGNQTDVQLLIDGSDSSTATIVASYIQAAVQHWQSTGTGRSSIALTTSTQSSELASANILRTRIYYNPELESREFMVPGILALVLMVMTQILTSLAIVKEKELGTLEQLIVTPLSSPHIIVGKLLPYILIGFIDVTLVTLATRVLFGVHFAGSIALLYLFTGIFLLTTLGLGLLVSTLSKNQQQAMMASVFFVMLPMIILSGFVFPIENMPAAIRAVTWMLPLRYYFTIIRGLFLKGAGFSVLWDEAAALLVYGLAIMGLSVARFRKKLE